MKSRDVAYSGVLAIGLVLYAFYLGVELTYTGKWQEASKDGLSRLSLALIVASIAWMVTARFSERWGRLSDLGLLDVHGSRSKSYGEFLLRMGDPNTQSVDILGICLTSVSATDLYEALGIRNKLDHGRTRILLLDPNSELLNRRLAMDSPTYDPVTAKSRIEAIDRCSGTRVEIRYYKCLPTFAMMRCDSEMVVAPYLYRCSGKDSPCLVVESRRNGISGKFQASFESLWEACAPNGTGGDLPRVEIPGAPIDTVPPTPAR